MSNKKFIITSDKPTVDKLITAGFSMIQSNGGTYVFLNQPPKNFNFSGLSDMKYCFPIY